MTPRIKICCIGSIAEAKAAIGFSASAVGLVARMPGGLNPGNVRKAVEEVHPFGIDVCSSVRTDGKLDIRKLELFFKEV